MVIDIRARVTCSLGDLISASISDDYIQGNGLVKTSGSCEINGLVSPAPGSPVTFTYTSFGVGVDIPRSLVVLSSFADPFKKITSVQIGCMLTYMQDLQEPFDITAFDDPENENFTGEDQEIVVVPISASAVAAECLSKIGITGSIPLTNKFSVEKFDFSSGYVNVLNDLLISESYCGYMGSNNELKIFSLQTPTGSARLIQQSDLIDVGPIGIGSLPGSPIIVNYSTLKLKDPEQTGDEDEEASLRRAWEVDEVIGTRTGIFLQGEYKGFTTRVGLGGVTVEPKGSWDNVFYYTPTSTTLTKYDSWDRVTQRQTIETSILAEGNSAYVTEAINVTGNQLVALVKLINKTTTNIVYKKQAPPLPENGIIPNNLEKEDGYDEVLSETTVAQQPFASAIGGAAGNYYDEETGNLYSPPTYPITTQITEISYETEKRDVEVTTPSGNKRIGYFPVTKTITKRKVLFSQTARGQQYSAKATEDGIFVGDILNALTNLVDGGVEIRTVTGREAVFQTRPNSTDRVLKDLSDGGDPNNGYRVESSSEAEAILGDGPSNRRIEFSMPYAPDDIFTKEGSGADAVFKAQKSDAKQKAALFGRVQNMLLMGTRNGISIQTKVSLMPPAPFSTFVVQANGISGLYATNGTSWTIDGNGIIASTDALFMGAIGKA